MTRIAAVIVGTKKDRLGHPDANVERINLAKQIAGFMRDKADVVLLPAGYLTVETEVDVKPQAKKLARIFGDVTLLAGIDELGEDTAGAKVRRASKQGTADSPDGYHYWAFASKAGVLLDSPWWQRSAYAGQKVRDSAARCVTTGECKIGVLICGELYNPMLASSLADAEPDIVVDLAHRSMTRFTKSLHRVAETTRCPVFQVQHVALNSSSAPKWNATPKRVKSDRSSNWASYDTLEWKPGALWAEVKIWNH